MINFKIENIKKIIKNKKFWIIFSVFIILILFFLGIYFYSIKEDFSINPIYPIKANIQEGGEFNAVIKVINNKNKIQNFNLYFSRFNESFSLSKNKLTLGPYESKEVQISFKDRNKKAEIYSGNLIIKSNMLEKKVPFLLSVEDPNKVFAIIYEPILRSEEIYPGGIFGITLKIFDLQEDYLKEAKIDYFIESLDGKMIYDEKNKSFVIQGKSSFSENFNIDKESPIGNYVLITSIDYNGIKSISGYLFKISKKENNFLKNNLNPFMMLILVFFIGILFLFVYFMKTREDFLTKLKIQQNKELEKNLKLINYSKKDFSFIFHGFKKKKKIKKLNEVKKRVIKKIKKKHKKQRIELKRLKKENKKDEIIKQLHFWKKQGYKILEVEDEIKNVSEKNIKNEILKWKKQGYKK